MTTSNSMQMEFIELKNAVFPDGLPEDESRLLEKGFYAGAMFAVVRAGGICAIEDTKEAEEYMADFVRELETYAKSKRPALDRYLEG
jgi:hypothetical protein